MHFLYQSRFLVETFYKLQYYLELSSESKLFVQNDAQLFSVLFFTILSLISGSKQWFGSLAGRVSLFYYSEPLSSVTSYISTASLSPVISCISLGSQLLMTSSFSSRNIVVLILRMWWRKRLQLSVGLSSYFEEVVFCPSVVSKIIAAELQPLWWVFNASLTSYRNALLFLCVVLFGLYFLLLK